MSNKITESRHGRPRAFDEAAVLRQAQIHFLMHGFEATSYDDIAKVTGLSKPSLYNAFGDKADLFERALTGYAQFAKSSILAAFTAADDFESAVRNMLRSAADVYAPPQTLSQGCLLIGTALPACNQHEALQATLTNFIGELEADLEIIINERFANSKFSPRARTLTATSLLFSLAVRARMGLPRKKLRAIADELANTVSPT